MREFRMGIRLTDLPFWNSQQELVSVRLTRAQNRSTVGLVLRRPPRRPTRCSSGLSPTSDRPLKADPGKADTSLAA